MTRFLQALLLILLGFFLLYPIAYVVPSSALEGDTWTGYYYGLLWRDEMIRRCMVTSLGLACATTVGTTVVALPLAYVQTRRRLTGSSVITSLVLVPLVLPPFVGALGLERFLGPYGTLNLLCMHVGLLAPERPIDWLSGAGFWGVLFLQVLHLYPIMYLNVAAALANVDPVLEDAARNLGAGEWRVFRTVTLPLLLPGYFAGASLVFVWAFTDLGTPLVFNYSQTLSVQVFNHISDRETNPLGYALVVTALVITAVLFVLGRWLLGRRSYATVSRGAAAGMERRLSVKATVAVWSAFLLLTALALLPHLGVLLMASTSYWGLTAWPTHISGDAFRMVFSEPVAYRSIVNSLTYSCASTLLDLVCGLAIAWLAVRKKDVLSRLLDALAMIPLALPGLVLAFGYLTCYQRLPLFGLERWLDPAKSPTLLLIVAYAVRRLPYMTRAAVAGLEQTPVVLEEAAANLGAGRWRIVRTVTLPLLAANLLAGAIFTFAFALLEVSDSLMLAQQEAYFPITRAIFGFWLRPDDGPYVASAMGVLGMILLGVSLAAAGLILGRKMGELFKA
ncbi:MAG: ABC transporter permease [Gemmataceae bacterium]